MKHCVIMFCFFSLGFLSFLLCFLYVPSPSGDPGLSGDAGPGARSIGQPALPRRRHPQSQTRVAEERNGPPAALVQTALSDW